MGTWHGFNITPAEVAERVVDLDGLTRLHIYGAQASAFRRGFLGQQDNRGNPRNSLAHLWYQAGRIAGGHRNH